ncbi:hypothetical protein OsI_27854 [Oryza sativa Indica Group]|uniref:Uncharacterized protein n=2 Tax=Oryza sativa TaxID=4530 RepID=A2YRC5_ORYSI|nr:hypothetical protein OsI_27854 [Oryza sativa Indica Group]KAF2918155.1 hypothetical protein DAI22_08g036300 [Oryza sativa Japonica Group]
MRCSCMVCLLLFFLLHLSVCHATSRNHRRLFAAAPAASPSTAALYGDDDITAAMHVWRSPRRYMRAAVEEKRGSPAPAPLPDGALGLQPGGVEGAAAAARTTEEEAAGAGAAMAPFPAAADVGGKDDGDSGDGGGSDGAADDAGVDYAPPKTHPPSHN